MVVMRFTLIYHGPLFGSGNKSKPDKVRDLRDQLHPQLKYLWDNNTALKHLRQSAIVGRLGPDLALTQSPFTAPRDLERFPIRENEVDLCEPIAQGGVSYIPLVRKSLDLNCRLDIHFLRQEDPGSLVLQGGDVDNRIKMLFDALRKPDLDVQQQYPQAHQVNYCLLESDSLIASFGVTTDRLLFPETEHPNEVHLLIEVTINVLRVGNWNVCLLGN
jgi:hypothetical protein